MKDRREKIDRDEKLQDSEFASMNKVGQADVDSCIENLEANK